MSVKEEEEYIYIYMSKKRNGDNLQTTYLQLLYRLRNVCNVVLCLSFKFILRVCSVRTQLIYCQS